MEEIVIATGNPHKVAELRAIFAVHAIPVVGLLDLPGHEHFREPPEHGTTFEANSTAKSLSYAAQTGRLCLADDSGLEVDALSGAPGVISSHYSTGGRDTGLSRQERDAANNARLLKDLEGVPLEKRTARFVCVMCLAAPDERILAITRGVFPGRIGLPGTVPRGGNGFGYDPLFILPGTDITSAELPPQEKNARSHRGAAARAMASEIRCLFAPAATPAQPATRPPPAPTPPPRAASTPPPSTRPP